MNILITIPWFHPAFKAGGPIQSIANLVNNFNDQINYFIYCGNTDLNDTQLEVTTGEWIKYNEHTKVWYAAAEKRSETLVKLTEKLQPDIIFIVGIFSWHFNMVPLLFCKAAKKFISTRGMLHPGALSEKSFKKKVYLSIWKFFDWHRKATFHASDADEKKYIEDVFGDEINVAVASNLPRRFSGNAPIKKKGHLVLASVALISPMKNHLLVLEALALTPAIIEYNICGPIKDMVYWQLCLERMKGLPVNISVVYHGEIMPDQVEAMLNNAHVFILPSKSENFGHAIYEALSAAKPVITSDHTPWQKLSSERAGINAGFNAEEISEAIMSFAEMGQEEYDVWSGSAREYALAAIDIEKIKAQYEIMFHAEMIHE